MKRMVTEKEIGEVAVDSVQGALDRNALHIGTNVLSITIIGDDLSGGEIVNAEIKEKLNAISESVIVGYTDNSGDIFMATSFASGVFASDGLGGSITISKDTYGKWYISYATDTYPSIGDLLADLEQLEADIRYIP